MVYSSIAQSIVFGSSVCWFGSWWVPAASPEVAPRRMGMGAPRGPPGAPWARANRCKNQNCLQGPVPAVCKDAFYLFLVPLPPRGPGGVRTVVSLNGSMILGRLRAGSGGKFNFKFYFDLKYSWVVKGPDPTTKPARRQGRSLEGPGGVQLVLPGGRSRSRLCL